ncbi:MAG: GNAT family N-acetyltransferase [Methylococcaceae bacterium]|nr:GNAT family protein [Prolixibacteraceae bacterium]
MGTLLQFETKRLLLRPIEKSDAEAVFHYRSDARVNRYQGWIPASISDVHYFINYKVSREMNLPGTWVQFVLIHKDQNQIIGDIGIHFLSADTFQVEMGCTLDQLYHGKGYASEALKQMIHYLFHVLDKRRIIASIDPGNESSIQLFERLGFRKEAHFRESIYQNGQWADDLVYAILKSEWKNEFL